MKIGRARRRVTLEAVAYTQNDYGEATKSYSTIGTYWAELMKTGSIGESITQGQDIAVKRLHFKIRSSADTRAVKADDRLTYKGEAYDILGVEEIGYNDQLVIIAQTTATI